MSAHVAVVAGAGGALGHATAVTLAADGLGRSGTGLARVEREMPGFQRRRRAYADWGNTRRI